ncbi:hypothetical protein FRC07_008841 [Ceratobasidium sp. 392]|nr:hypothetical protein FRC07_008841 [Ceratobasidium sp. 392]
MSIHTSLQSTTISSKSKYADIYKICIVNLGGPFKLNLSNRKRKINIDGNVAWASGSGSASKDANDLKMALRGCNAVDFVQALSKSLDDESPETIHTLKTVLMPLIQPDNSPKHCVRCHGTYYEPSNTVKSCVIRCMKPEETDFPDEEYDRVWERYMWKFPCCGRLIGYDEEYECGDYGGGSEDSEYDSKDSGQGFGHRDMEVCCTAKHTTDPTLPKYYISWSKREKEQDGLDYSGRNKNVRTCKMMGCKKDKPKRKSKRKISTDEGFVFASGSGSIIEDMGDLKEALSCCNGDDFLQALSDSLDATPPETIQVLKSILIPLIQASTGPKHCARCHRSYHESSNTINSCVVKCVKPTETSYPDKYSDRPWEYYMWKFPCCNRLVSNDDLPDPDDLENWDEYNNFVCSTAKHTTDPTSVKYFSPWQEEKEQEKGVDYSGRNKNVRTCKMARCGKE